MRSRQILYYAGFGVLHETFHVLAASALFGKGLSPIPSISIFLRDALFGRFVKLSDIEDEYEEVMVRHAGWILSLMLAIALYLRHQYQSSSRSTSVNSSSASSIPHMAAAIVAVEAISSDLLRLGVINNLTTPVFFCGNFGAILLHQNWNDSDTIFDLLSRMIQITMMRGAQSGGVVAWDSLGDIQHAKAAKQKLFNKANVVRVIKGKRQDLSRLLSSKIRRQCSQHGKKHPSIQTFLGHTRFATSSKATLDGTHPHRWTPPELRRVYPLDDEELWRSTKPRPMERPMVNYITANGDFDFFKMHGKLASLSKIQRWLACATCRPIPAQVDSACIAGMIDILRTAGCWGLSLRFAMLLGVPGRTYLDPDSRNISCPSYFDFSVIGELFENSLEKFCNKQNTCLNDIKSTPALRRELLLAINEDIHHSALEPLLQESGNLESQHFLEVIRVALDAFFDNDLFFATKYFMDHAIGSFGIMVTSSEDSNRQICIAARAQPMSVAFYPKKGLICFASELAAAKAGMSFYLPGGDLDLETPADVTDDNISQHTCRIDLDDVAGEIMLLDWSQRNEHGEPIAKVRVHREGSKSPDKLQLRDRGRMTMLEGNELLLPLPVDDRNVVANDILEIPNTLEWIQKDWQNNNLNRLTAFSLSRALKRRVRDRISGAAPLTSSTVDILVTGCEVSLWLAEQFASDLQKALPRLSIKAMSSNKILGILGQDLAVPARGFPVSTTATDFHDSIVLFVSQSGGTFAPSAISNLLQSVTTNLFVVTSEWDTQMSKRLRAMPEDANYGSWNSRVFTTNVGLRTAEPCTLTVAATHQLLTEIFKHICAVILEQSDLRCFASITENDLLILETCSRSSIRDLRSIVGDKMSTESRTEKDLTEMGNIWANHVLENVKAIILSFLYVVGTVTAGYPLITGILTAFGATDPSYFYVARFLDGLFYFFCPHFFIMMIRLVERRDLLHRVEGGRTVVIADIPWVAQAAEALLTKLFACSYSLAGLTVLSANAEDHFVHRHTHKVVRGTLLVAGRPDGRLSSLISAESAVNLAVSQAASIINLGGGCEAITIGHNPTKLGLSRKDIILPSTRTNFLGEHLQERKMMQKALVNRQQFNDVLASGNRYKIFKSSNLLDFVHKPKQNFTSTGSIKAFYLEQMEPNQSSTFTPRRSSIFGGSGLRRRSSLSSSQKSIEIAGKQIAGAFGKMEQDIRILQETASLTTESVQANGVRNSLAASVISEDAPLESAEDLKASHMDGAANGISNGTRPSHVLFRDERSFLQIKASLNVDYFGQDSEFTAPSYSQAFKALEEQSFAIELYESRIASLQRFVAMCVMFHQMGKRVQDFISKASFGIFSYRIDRTHSILRVATTASPVSGDAVQARMKVIRKQVKDRRAASKIQVAWKRYRTARVKSLLRKDSQRRFFEKQSSRGSSLMGSYRSIDDIEEESSRYSSASSLMASTRTEIILEET